MLRLFLAAAFFVAVASAALAAQDAPARKIVHAGWLLAVPGERPATDKSLLVEGDAIVAVRDGFVSAADAGWQGDVEIVDLKSAFVLPGFVDLHVHLTSPVEPGGDLRVVTDDRATLALLAAKHAEVTVEAGVTTVLDLGTGRREHEAAIYALRAAVEKGWARGPRIYAVGSPLSATGSARTGLYREDVEAAVGPEAECDGPEDCRRAAREQIKRGADVVSFYNTGSLMDEVVAPMAMTEAEMRAIVETAHMLGKPAIADGHNAAGVNAALRAGADAIISGTWPDDETWKLMRRTGAYLVSHIYAFEASVGEDGTMSWLPDYLQQRLIDIKNKPYAAERAIKRGIPMALGSDTGVIHHGENLRDLVEYVARGMDEMDAIEMATTNGAKVLRIEGEIGRLAPGMKADLVALGANPLEDISAVLDVRYVMQGGRAMHEVG